MSCKYTKSHLYQLEGRDDKYIRNRYLYLFSLRPVVEVHEQDKLSIAWWGCVSLINDVDADRYTPPVRAVIPHECPINSTNSSGTIIEAQLYKRL